MRIAHEFPTIEAARKALPTERQLAALRAVSEYVAAHGFPPSVRDLAGALGISSTNAVTNFVAALVRKRLLVRGPRGAARALAITPAGRAALRGNDSRPPRRKIPGPEAPIAGAPAGGRERAQRRATAPAGGKPAPNTRRKP